MAGSGCCPTDPFVLLALTALGRRGIVRQSALDENGDELEVGPVDDVVLSALLGHDDRAGGGRASEAVGNLLRRTT